eukprot:2033295-Rhodomonas_salina.3
MRAKGDGGIGVKGGNRSERREETRPGRSQRRTLGARPRGFRFCASPSGPWPACAQSVCQTQRPRDRT